MPQTIQAVYEHGVFVPSTPVDLPEHTRVTISIPTKGALTKKSFALDAIVGIASDCKDTDLSVNHDKYLYGEDHQ